MSTDCLAILNKIINEAEDLLYSTGELDEYDKFEIGYKLGVEAVIKILKERQEAAF